MSWLISLFSKESTTPVKLPEDTIKIYTDFDLKFCMDIGVK